MINTYTSSGSCLLSKLYVCLFGCVCVPDEKYPGRVSISSGRGTRDLLWSLSLRKQKKRKTTDFNKELFLKNAQTALTQTKALGRM